MFAGIFFGYLHFQKVLDLLGEQNSEISDKREELPIAMLIPFFLTVFFQYFSSQSIEAVFYAQIYTYARCESYTMKDATKLTALYWAAFGVSRFLAVFVAKLIKPMTYLAISLSREFYQKKFFNFYFIFF